MLFTAPAFLFLFLPIALLVYVVCVKRHRRIGLLCVCVAYHLLLWINTPVNLLFLPLLILYTYGGGKLLTRHPSSPRAFAVCVLPYVALIFCRMLAYHSTAGFVYPVGLTVAVMCSTSYLLQILRGTVTRRHTLFDLALYLSFFPIMIVGPFVKYDRFLELTAPEGLSFDLPSFSFGIRRFSVGLIKRIGIGAVLMETYTTFADFSQESPDVMQIFFLLILIYYGIYFTVTGYSDMGCGLANMFGVKLRYVHSTPFHAAVPDEYCRSMIYSLQDWMDDYLIRPMTRLSGGRFVHAIRAVVYGSCLLLFVRSESYVLLLALPLIAIEYAVSRFHLENRLLRQSGLRILSTLLTMGLVSVGWMLITFGDLASILDYLSRLSFANSEYHMDLMLVSFSGIKYVFVILVAILLILPGFGGGRLPGTRSARGEALIDGGSMILIFVLLLFTLVFFLPDYPLYSTTPFQYVYI